MLGDELQYELKDVKGETIPGSSGLLKYTALQVHMREDHLLPCDTAQPWYVDMRHRRDHLIHPWATTDVHGDPTVVAKPIAPGTTRALYTAVHDFHKTEHFPEPLKECPHDLCREAVRVQNNRGFK
jgi:hypothetical protein